VGFSVIPSQDALLTDGLSPADGAARRRALRAYVLVYAALADQEGARPAGGTMAALHVLLGATPVGTTSARKKAKDPFPFGEPETSSEETGYSLTRDVLWVRPHHVFRDDESQKNRTGLDTAAQLLYSDRNLWPRLRAFVTTERWRSWQERPMRTVELRAADRDAYVAIAHEHGPARVPYRGVLLVGHDPKRYPGLFVLGVRRQEWLVGAMRGERLWWLLQRPDLVRELGVGVGPDLGHLLDEVPSFRGFAGRPSAFGVAVARLLGSYDEALPGFLVGRRYAEATSTWLPTVRVGRRTFPAAILTSVHENQRTARVQLEGALAAFQEHRGPERGTPQEFLVVAAGNRASVERALQAVLVERPVLGENTRFLLAHDDILFGIARRHPWLWLLAKRSDDRYALEDSYVTASYCRVQERCRPGDAAGRAYLDWLQAGARPT
jgi:hypothetical protein